MNFLHSRAESPLSRLSYIGFSLVMAILYDRVIWNKELGIGVFLFTLLYVCGLLGLSFLFRHLRSPKYVFLAVPLFVFTLDIALYTNDFVQIGAPLFVFLVGLVFSVLITLDNPFKQRFSFLHVPVVRNIFLVFTKYKLIFADIFASKDERSAQIVKKISLGILIAFPLLLIFAAFFVDADAIFAQKLKNLFHFDNAMLWRVIRTILITLGFSALFYTLIAKEHALNFKEKTIKKFDTVIVGTILTLINALFLTFVVIQIQYLFAGKAFVFQNDITSANYARSGFFELICVILLSALIMLIVYRSYSAHKPPVYLSILQIVLLVQVGVIAASALERMNIYETDYGYTVLRLYVEWFIYFVMFTLLVSVVSLIVRVSFWRFFYITVLTGLAALLVVSSLNVENLIATENISRFLDDKKPLDLVYFKKLSLDALPATLSLLSQESLDKLSVGEKLTLQDIFKKDETRIKEHDSWLEWNKSVSRARELLTPERMKTFELIFTEAKAQEKQFQAEKNTIYAKLQTISPSNCDEVKSTGSSEYYRLRDSCSLIVKSESERYLAFLSEETYREGKTLATTSGKPLYISVYKIYEVNFDPSLKKNTYREIYARVFPQEKVRENGYRSDSEDVYPGLYENMFILLKDGSVVESLQSDKVNYIYTAVFAGEKSFLEERSLFNQ